MSGAYSTERISTLKYSGSSAAATAPAKASVRRVDGAREDHGVRADRGLHRRSDVERVAAAARPRGAEVVAVAEVAAEQGVDAARDDGAVGVEQNHRAHARDRVAQRLHAHRQQRRDAVHGGGEEVVAHAREGAVHAVELLADVVVDDARLHAQAVALGGVERFVRLEERPADQHAENDEAEQERRPFGGELAREAGLAFLVRRRSGGRVPRRARGDDGGQQLAAGQACRSRLRGHRQSRRAAGRRRAGLETQLMRAVSATA